MYLNKLKIYKNIQKQILWVEGVCAFKIYHFLLIYLFDTIYKNKLKMDKRFKCKSQHHKSPRREHR